MQAEERIVEASRTESRVGYAGGADSPSVNERRSAAMQGRQNAKKSGRYALEASLKRGGFGVLPRNQRETIAEWRQAVEQDCGGREQLLQLKRLQL
jgi:hypothetical protein